MYLFYLLKREKYCPYIFSRDPTITMNNLFSSPFPNRQYYKKSKIQYTLPLDTGQSIIKSTDSTVPRLNLRE
jgi:hypothetical protein